jgi:hypothetical protein
MGDKPRKYTYDDIQKAYDIAYEVCKIRGLTAEAKDAQIIITLRNSTILEDNTPSIYTVNDNHIYSTGQNKIRFWTSSSFLLYLLNPVASYKTHAIFMFKRHHSFLGHVIQLVNGVPVDRLYFAQNINVMIFESIIWHNCCYIQALEKKQIIDIMVTEEKVDQFLQYYINVARELRRVKNGMAEYAH